MQRDYVKDKIYLASNIKFLRKLKNLNQQQLANVFGYSDTTISNWENGTRIPESLDLYRISKFFEVDVDSLMTINLSLNYEKFMSNTIEELKQRIRNLPTIEMNAEGKESLINMVDTLNKLSKK